MNDFKNTLKKDRKWIALIIIVLTPLLYFGVVKPTFDKNTTINTKPQQYIQNNHGKVDWDRIKIGMTKKEVKAAWGNPMDIITSVSVGNLKEDVWGYNCDLGGCLILHFENNKLIRQISKMNIRNYFINSCKKGN